LVERSENLVKWFGFGADVFPMARTEKVEHGYAACGIKTFGTGTPQLVHLLWCFNEDGHEAIAVVYAPADCPADDLKPTLYRSVIAGPVEKLFPCEGVLNREPLQCTGPFNVPIGSETHRMFVVNWTTGDGLRAFLVMGAIDREHAMRPIWNFYQQSGKPNDGTHLIASDTIKLIAEMDPVLDESLHPKHDFEFIQSPAMR